MGARGIRTKKIYHDPETIERIRSTVQTQKIIERLSKHVLEGAPLEMSQIRAAEILLRKVMPDLQASESTVTLKRNVSDYTTDELLAALASYGIARPQGSADKPH